MIYQYDSVGDDGAIFKRDSGGPDKRLTEAGSITWFALASNGAEAKKITDALNTLLEACGRRVVER